MVLTNLQLGAPNGRFTKGLFLGLRMDCFHNLRSCVSSIAVCYVDRNTFCSDLELP